MIRFDIRIYIFGRFMNLCRIHDEINAKLGKEDAAANGSWQNCVQEIFSDPVYQTVRMKSAYISPEVL